MGKGFLVVVMVVVCVMLAASALAECLVTLGENELGCNGAPWTSCGLASLPDNRQIVNMYCALDDDVSISTLSGPSPNLIFSVFVELA